MIQLFVAGSQHQQNKDPDLFNIKNRKICPKYKCEQIQTKSNNISFVNLRSLLHIL
jgi:hypothetical protein